MQWRLLQCEKDPRKKCNVILKGKETCLGGDKVWCQKADEYTTTLQDFLCRYSPHPPWEFPSCVCGVVWVEEENREKKIKWQAEEKGKNVVVVTVLPQHKFGFHEEEKNSFVRIHVIFHLSPVTLVVVVVVAPCAFLDAHVILCIYRYV